MRINLQRFAFSTLTFSLATTLAMGGFSESASAQQRGVGASYGTSDNLPALNFDVFLKNEDGTDINDVKDDENIGVFKNAIEIINNSDNFTQVRKEDLDTDLGADVKGNIFVDQFNDFPEPNKQEKTPASFSAELNDDKITYQIFLGDYENPDQFLKFAPVDVSSRSEDDKNDLVNNLGFILDDSKEGTFDVISQNNLLDEPKVGVLGRAIDLSLNFQGEEKPKEFEDFLKITKFDSPPSTTIPEPTTTLASVFALAFAGKFLRKSKKSNA